MYLPALQIPPGSGVQQHTCPAAPPALCALILCLCQALREAVDLREQLCADSFRCSVLVLLAHLQTGVLCFLGLFEGPVVRRKC